MSSYSPTDHRQHITALLRRDLLEPATLAELKAAWSRRPSFEPRGSAGYALSFTEEASKLLHSLEAWVQSEEQATQAHALKVQQCFGIQVEARYATVV
ncbi:hypothetical protein CVIRNUC_004715 [Coccomyxa viridis]|uniref:Uncharacterized protein n=1 Tax=Coccomyxa viridis TaxID=1274662 RepID=A0AAV1I4V8_9CHLO|nr:hypothetical protein CVIRNUC_004715 [Coccomyxa viridis]